MENHAPSTGTDPGPADNTAHNPAEQPARATPGWSHMRLDPAGHITQDIPCVQCGYDLRGLALAGQCPECGLDIGASTREEMLRFADPQWLGRLARGSRMACRSLLAGLLAPMVILLLWMGSDVLSRNAVRWLESCVSYLFMLAPGWFVLLTTLATVGLWQTISPEPPTESGRRDLQAARQTARVCMLLAAAVTVTLVTSILRGGDSMGWLLDLAVLGWLGTWITCMLVLRRLMERVPAACVARQLLMVGRLLVLVWGASLPSLLILSGADSSRLWEQYWRYGSIMPAMWRVSPRWGIFLVLASLVLAIWSIVLLRLCARHFARAARQAAELRSTGEAPPLAIDPQGRMAADLLCARCGYNLRGISPQEVCPECGLPAQQSVAQHQLRQAEGSWVEGVTGSLRWAAVGVACAIALALAVRSAQALIQMMSSAVGNLYMVLASLHWVGMLLGAIGAWQVLGQGPAQLLKESRRIRLVGRICLVLWLVLTSHAVLRTIGVLPLQVVLTPGYVVEIAGWICLLVYLQRLLRHLHRDAMVDAVRLAAWGVGLLGAAWLCLWLLPILGQVIRGLMIGRWQGVRFGRGPGGWWYEDWLSLAVRLAWQAWLVVTVVRVSRTMARGTATDEGVAGVKGCEGETTTTGTAQ